MDKDKDHLPQYKWYREWGWKENNRIWR